MATALEKWESGHYHREYGGTIRRLSKRPRFSNAIGKQYIYTKRKRALRARKVEHSSKEGTREVVREGRCIIEATPANEKVIAFRRSFKKTPKDKRVKQEVKKQRAGMPEI